MDVIDAFKTHFAKLTATLRRRGSSADDAEDVVQEAFVRLLHYIEKGEEVKGIEGFLTRVALNIAIDISRRERKHLREGRSVDELVCIDARADLEQEVADMEYLRRTAELLDQRVGKRARQVFHLCCFDEMTYAEVGRQLGISVATVQRDLARATFELALHESPGEEMLNDF